MKLGYQDYLAGKSEYDTGLASYNQQLSQYETYKSQYEQLAPYYDELVKQYQDAIAAGVPEDQLTELKAKITQIEQLAYAVSQYEAYFTSS
ncbi:hypothetical protein SD457_15255 [Coprobacillaceae bacterium CR2/5/TPMF4]|nr:hypothetical protein SD457_15255 [Coprobacillaceae bacterium CR2/5/TPMF4]